MRSEFHIRRRAKLVVGLAILAATWAFVAVDPTDGTDSKDLEQLFGGDSGLKIQEGSFRWVWSKRAENSGSLEWQTAVFLARPSENALGDVFVADFRTTSGGGVREFRRLTNLTRTADSDEDYLEASGERLVAFSGKLNGKYRAVGVLDFGGESPHLTADWSGFWKFANGITNYQRTGRFEGIDWKNFIFREPSTMLRLSFTRANKIELTTSAGEFVLQSGRQTAASDLMVQEMEKGRPAFLAWSVDTVREIPWVGRRKIEWLEKIWFDFNDWLLRTKYKLVGESSEDEEDEYEPPREMVATGGVPGWPPANLTPMLKKKKAIAGEGVWIPVDDDFVTQHTYGPPLFYRTFVRPDPERPFSRVHLTAWDPSMLELKVMAGVREPRSSTGTRGKGEIPRDGDESEIERLVGAFNGAFQALHGEWGMVVNREVLLPPRAYGATIGVYRDGTIGMGTWPYPVADMPEEMRDLRQNVHPLVENGVFNPYERVWWGGVPQGVEERVVTARSGICLTTGGKFVYFWGQHLSPESLGASMVAGGCEYGIHLDMNPGHCGLEYYRVDRVGEQPPLTRKPDDAFEVEGSVPRREDLVFRAKKMAKNMGNMRFPRYVSKDPRDFFYLLKKETVFDGVYPASGDDSWTAMGAVEGYPVPAVRTGLGADAVLYKFDLAQTNLSVEKEKPNDALWAAPFAVGAKGIVLGLKVKGEEVFPLQTGAPVLDINQGNVAVLDSGKDDGDSTIVQGVWPSMADKVGARHEVAVDPAGFFYVYSSMRESGKSGGGLSDMDLGKSMVLASPNSDTSGVFWLVVRQEKRPAWKRIFTDVKPVPPSKWRAVFKKRGRLLEHEDE